jgi:hypothetical protein
MSKRVFISFAVEDSNLRDFLVGQAKNNNSPFEFVDMSVKDPWSSSWKTNCRTKIKGCDGLIAIATNNTRVANGQLWEINCAQEEYVPVKAVWGHPDERPSISVLSGVRTVDWKWDNIKSLIDSF